MFRQTVQTGLTCQSWELQGEHFVGEEEGRSQQDLYFTFTLLYLSSEAEILTFDGIYKFGYE